MKRGFRVKRIRVLEECIREKRKKIGLASPGRISEFFERSGKTTVFALILLILLILGAFFILRGA